MIVPVLFVYGSLLSDFTKYKSITKELHDQSQLLGSTLLPGKLFDIGKYPGFVYDRNSSFLVRGELLELKNANRLLKVLDDYEGGEYTRVLLESTFLGNPMKFNTYLYQLSIAQLPEILENDYREFVKDNFRHQQFIGIY